MTLVSDRFAKNSRLQQAARNAPAIGQGERDRLAVALLQQALSVLGFPMPKSTRKTDGEMDGIYGEETFHVIHLFQFQQKLFGPRGNTDGIAGKNTLHRLDQLVRPIHHVELPGKSPLVMQKQLTCWAAAIESATYGRYKVNNLVTKFGKQPAGDTDSVTLKTSVARHVGMHIFSVPVPSRNVRDMGLAILGDLTRVKKPVLLCAYQALLAHCVAIYGIDGVGGKLTLIRCMDPLKGYQQYALETIIPKATGDLMLGTQAQFLQPLP